MNESKQEKEFEIKIKKSKVKWTIKIFIIIILSLLLIYFIANENYQNMIIDYQDKAILNTFDILIKDVNANGYSTIIYGNESYIVIGERDLQNLLGSVKQ